METEFEHKVYSKSVLEFVTVAAEYVIFAEGAESEKRKDFLAKSQKLLPLIYLKSAMLSDLNSVLDEATEKFVTEEDWMQVQQSISRTLGKFDIFTEVHEPIAQQDEESLSVSLSECYADIYQDLADFIQVYRMGDTDMMNDALWECKQNFEQYWGPKLLVLVNNIHNIIYGSENWQQDSIDDKAANNVDSEAPEA